MVVRSFGMYWSPTRAAAPPRSSQPAAAAQQQQQQPSPPLSPARDIIQRADRRARDAERWWAEGAAAALDVRRKRLEQRQSNDAVLPSVDRLAAGEVDDLVAGWRRQGAGLSHARTLAEVEQRVEEAKVAAVAAVFAARQETLSQLSRIGVASGGMQQVCVPQQSHTPPTLPRSIAAQSLHHAVASASVVAVVRVLDGDQQRVDGLDGRGRSAMWLAASKGYGTIIAVLAEHGADINFACGGMTPSYAAAGSGQTDALRVLTQLGADIERPDAHHITPISIAAHQGHLDVVRMLADLGANLESASENGATPFWSACHAGKLEVATFLASRGVDIWQSAKQRSPREIARLEGHVAIVQLIDSRSDSRENRSSDAPRHPLVEVSSDIEAPVQAPNTERLRIGATGAVARDAVVEVGRELIDRRFGQSNVPMLVMDVNQPGACDRATPVEEQNPTDLYITTALSASASHGEVVPRAVKTAVLPGGRNSDASVDANQWVASHVSDSLVESHQQTSDDNEGSGYSLSVGANDSTCTNAARIAKEDDNEKQLSLALSDEWASTAALDPKRGLSEHGGAEIEAETSNLAVHGINGSAKDVQRTLLQGDPEATLGVAVNCSIPNLKCLPAEVCRTTSDVKLLLSELGERCVGLQGVSTCVEELDKLTNGTVVSTNDERSILGELWSCTYPLESVVSNLRKMEKDMQLAENKVLQRASNIEAEVADFTNQLAAAERDLENEGSALIGTTSGYINAQQSKFRDQLERELGAAVAAAEVAAAMLTTSYECEQQDAMAVEKQASVGAQWHTDEKQALDRCSAAESKAATSTQAAHTASVAATKAAEELEQLHQIVLSTDQDRLSRQNQIEILQSSSKAQRQLEQRLDAANRIVQQGKIRGARVQEKIAASLEAAAVQTRRLGQMAKDADALVESQLLVRKRELAENSERLLRLRTDSRRSLTADAATEGQTLRAQANAAAERLRKVEVKLRQCKIEQASQQANLDSKEKALEGQGRAWQDVQHPLLGANERLTAARDSLGRHERERAAAENEAVAADEELAMLRSELERILKRTEQLYVERREATEAVQTIAAKFEQVGAELELSYDDAGAKPEARRQELARLRKQHADNQDYVLEMEEELAELRTQNDQLRRKAASIERELAESGRRPTMIATQRQPRSKISTQSELGARRPAQSRNDIEGDPNARPRPRKENIANPQPMSGAGFEEVLTVGSRFKGSVDQAGRKLMYNLKITRVGAQAGHLLGQQTLLTATNVITIHALPGIPNLIRIAEKSKGGLEAVGEVDVARGAIEGMITIAGEECPFTLGKVV